MIAAGEWSDQAACRSVSDPDLFFPDGWGTKAHRQQVAEAKAVCGRCPVRAECLNDALDRADVHGVAGGLTPEEREPLLRRRRLYRSLTEGDPR